MPTALELLREALPTLPVGSDLANRILRHLNEPVLVGDTLTLEARWPSKEENDPETPGLSKIPYTGRHREFDFDSRKYTGEILDFEGAHKLFPEAALCARMYDFTALGSGIVVPINGRRYRVHITVGGDSRDSFGSAPGNAIVALQRTEDPETEFKPFVQDEEVASEILRLRAANEACAARLAEEDDESEARWLANMIRDDEIRIACLEGGSERPWPQGPVTFFGQPQFLQNEIYPAYQGRAAMHLATLNTNWGDSGNVNVLFACDENGVPCRAWFEASCC